ncbi:MAG: DUF2911 domain-containing protein [Flammeovirgaceae bacterium]
MKKGLTTLLLAIALLIGANTYAQVRVPAPSPEASVSGVIGVTKVNIEYSAPGVKGRKIWGDLLPFDKVWRAGANSATKITFEDDVTLNGTAVKGGSYSLYMTPKKDGNWTVYLDPNNKSVFAYGEDEAKIKAVEGMIMFNAKAEKTKNSLERLAYTVVADTENKGGTVSLHWEKMKVSFEVKTDAAKLMEASVKRHYSWYTMANTANYYIDNNMDMKLARQLAETSLKMGDHFYNKWIMAKLYAKEGDAKKAVEYAQAAKKWGDANPSNFYNVYKDEIAASITKWQ